MAAAKAGIKIVDVDINLTDISEIRSFLTASNCKVIYFKPEHEEHDYLLLLRKAIPEFFECKMNINTRALGLCNSYLLNNCCWFQLNNH